MYHDNHNFTLPNSSPFESSSFADTDWTTNVHTCHSVSRIAIFLAGVPITYKCKLQNTVTLSSTESELYAACEAAKNIKYIRSIINHLGLTPSSPTPIYKDNAATIAVFNNQRATKYLCHIDLCHFAILELVKNGDVVLKPITTSDNPVDELTKLLRNFLYG